MTEIRSILINNGLQIRTALSSVFPQYSIDHIAIIPELLSHEVAAMASNILPLGFVIDVGKQYKPLNNNHSDKLCEKLIECCPELNDIHFGVWIREIPRNGFTEHKIGGVQISEDS